MDSLEIDPFNSDRFLYGTGMTLYGSNDLTKWDSGGVITIKPFVFGQEEMSVQDLSVPPTGPLLYSAMGDVSGYTHTSLTSPPSTAWLTPTFRSGKSVDFAELKPAFVVRSGDATSTSNPYFGVSNDAGSNWYSPSGTVSGVTGGGHVAVSSDGNNIVWAPGGASAVYYSSTQGNSWTASTGVPAGAYVSSDRVNPLKFYAASGSSVYLSIDGGKTFTTGPTLAGSTLSSSRPLKAVPGLEGVVYLALGTNGFYVSTNSGSSFTKISTVTGADAFGFGIAGPGPYKVAIYISGTIDSVAGFFRSDDGGASWVRINDNLHQYGATNIAVAGDMRVYGRVFVGTNGLVVAPDLPLPRKLVPLQQRLQQQRLQQQRLQQQPLLKQHQQLPRQLQRLQQQPPPLQLQRLQQQQQQQQHPLQTAVLNMDNVEEDRFEIE
ncbi:hypothetical protein HK096_009815 [Nowakowskiella sp. JEL0078]|nr:hypothetical protein HK096_009815 [Nowakowskiella sp. JEL0078]